MNQVKLTNKQARQFILLKQGLMGDYKFEGEKGICDYIRQAGCIQFDPIDVCGKNAELVLQSRVNGFTKDMLYKLLYIDRKLIDYLDKNMSIFDIKDWKYFSRIRADYEQYDRSREQIDQVSDNIKTIIKEKGYASSRDIKLDEKVDWSWNPTSLSRATLESLYFRGELIIHHKEGTIKHYALAEDYMQPEIFNAIEPLASLEEHNEWRVLRRIGAVGMLWNKPSDALLGIGLKSVNRNTIFNKLLKYDKIIEIKIQDITNAFYCLSDDQSLLDIVLSNVNFTNRTEFIAPLDNMIWDRKLIKEIFNFEYKWEIYTPMDERKYGYYVLPILSGDRFIGRIEIVNDKKLNGLIVNNIWFEDGVNKSVELYSNINDCIDRFSRFNNCERIKYECKICTTKNNIVLKHGNISESKGID